MPTWESPFDGNEPSFAAAFTFFSNEDDDDAFDEDLASLAAGAPLDDLHNLSTKFAEPSKKPSWSKPRLPSFKLNMTELRQIDWRSIVPVKGAWILAAIGATVGLLVALGTYSMNVLAAPATDPRPPPLNLLPWMEAFGSAIQIQRASSRRNFPARHKLLKPKCLFRSSAPFPAPIRQ